MTADDGLAVTTLCWAVAAIAALSIAIPQSLLLVRTAIRRDDLWWFRLKTTLLFGSLGLAMLRNLAVWADYACCDQTYLGTVAQRWPLDLGLAVVLTAACLLAAFLFWMLQRERRP